MSSAVNEITVIGATGSLARPTISRWLEQGLQVKAIVRNPEKARSRLPESVQLIHGDLRDVESLRRGLEGTRHLYLNLSTSTLRPDLDFYTEREGIANLLMAARGQGIEQILKISGMGVLHPEFSLQGRELFPNAIRKPGHVLLRESGIPFTLFHPSWFLDALPRLIRGGTFTMIGQLPHPIYFNNTDDYAQQVQTAMGNPDAFNRDFAIQGPHAILFDEAAKRFLAITAPDTPIRRIPMWLAQGMGLFNAEVRLAAHMMAFFMQFRESLVAEETWKVLGMPTTSLEDFFQRRTPHAATQVVSASK
ncbi:MAG: NAD(P)H-binding protein [Myxococcota bacterium]